MSIVEFRPYKRLGDKELIIETYKKMEIMRLATAQNDEETYDREATIFNNMIKEIKLRKLKAKDEIFENILFHFHK